jgi:hypothetical protein
MIATARIGIIRIVIAKAASTFIEMNTGSLAIFIAIRRASPLLAGAALSPSVVVVVRATIGATIDPPRCHPSPPIRHVGFGLILAE